jgi:hypothetical protein
MVLLHVLDPPAPTPKGFQPIPNVSAAEIEKNLAIQSREIELERKTEVQRAEQRMQVEMARQDTQIAISNKCMRAH